MPRGNQRADTVRASREGHEFHEAWTARKAMQLLLPRDGLTGIAVEGLSEEDQAWATAETVEVADLTVYYGQDATFRDAYKVETLQFKYSPKRYDKEFRASDAKKTIEKFAASYRDYKQKFGAAAVTKKLSFELVTNRPIFPPLQTALDALAQGKRITGQLKPQADQFEKATGLTGKPLAEFARKCRITGLAGSLRDTQTDLSKLLVDWSATADARAKARLGDMKEMVRRKAGYDAEHRKVIRQVDVLSALGLSDVTELLPCPEQLPNVGKVVEREQLEEAASLILSTSKPLVIHADGGIGKTVFLESLASLLSAEHEVVFFDCFGGGAYRAAEDGRHLPNRGLIHIANKLACRGLCDPILPETDNTETLFSTFRRRLLQCVETLSAASSERELILFVDAIDNAAEFAQERKQRAFPVLLLESIHISGPIQGVRIVASGRTHRIRKYLNKLHYREFELRPFSRNETVAYLSARMPDITDIEISVAQSRAEGNGRILEHLVTSDRGLLDESELDNPILLNELLTDQIDSALTEAQKQGYEQYEIDAFLAGLSVLPPPVPLDEYAGAHGMDIGAVRSFASDLAPLLDRTPQGVIFRDEPTETLVRENYGTNKKALRRVADNLLARQEKSVYAARALPGLLQVLKDGKRLFHLAFDERFPALIKSAVGQRRIRYARLKAAVQHAAGTDDKNMLVRLLVELSSVAASEQKGADYIVDNPDLVVNAADADAMRRLYEARTTWPGARHARLTVASVLSGDLENSSRHFRKALAWIRHDVEDDTEDNYDRPRPDSIDRVAIPIFQLSQREHGRAIRFMRVWYSWYAYELSEWIFELSRQAVPNRQRLRRTVENYLDDLTNEIGLLAASLSFADCSDSRRRSLIRRLAKACKRTTKLKTSGRIGHERSYELPDGLRKSATVALSFGMDPEARVISLRAPHQTPGIWVLNSQHSGGDVFPFLFRVALKSAISGVPVHERDILPGDLAPYAKRLGREVTGQSFARRIKERIEKQIQKQRDVPDTKKKVRDDLKGDASRFLDYRLAPLLQLTQALSAFLRAPLRKADKRFQDLLGVWRQIRRSREGYYYAHQFNFFYQSLGTRIALFALWSRKDLKIASVRSLLKDLHEQNYLSPGILIEVISIIARRPRFDILAGEQALNAKALIEREDEVVTRAKLFASLARAIRPVSPADAAEYFRMGLEQLDAIGSGDYDFTNELLIFASSIKGDELSTKDFHTLTNICELNMPHEEEKFPWGAFAGAMSKVSGPRGLAKLARWHDREKIGLEFTLLPYLTRLVHDGKIEPEDAIALNRLAYPVELWEANTAAFAETIHERQFDNQKTLITELIQQYEDNNPRLPSGNTTKVLVSIAEDALGRRHATTRYLRSAYKRFEALTDELNQQMNYSPVRDKHLGRGQDNSQQRLREVRAVATETDPLDQESLEKAAARLKEESHPRDLEDEFFNRIRKKVRHADRQQYLTLVVRLEELDSYAKFRELARCKDMWRSSSANLDSFYRDFATPILEIHAEEFLSFDRLSGYRIKEVSELTGVSRPVLTLELIKIFAMPDWTVPAAAWLGLASIICDDTNDGHAQKALAKLLNSGSAKLTATVTDGPWKRGLYPSSDMTEIAAGLVWQMLGSPRASDRWQAAHSVRCFARLGRWNIVDALANKLESRSSKHFSAPELPFFYLHARIWLLIALARIARDSPLEVANYASTLTRLALRGSRPHVLIRHFAAQALLVCDTAGALSFAEDERKQLQTVNESPLPHRSDGERCYPYHGFYQGRPKDAPESEIEFTLDYDFNKTDVHGLADVFCRPGWQVEDLVKEEAYRLDPEVTSMFEKAGRVTPYRRNAVGLTSEFHVYGQYLAWHALWFAAAQLLSKYPITENWEDGQPWSEWLSYGLLTRSDGLWLSDGMDRPPTRAKVNMLEKGEEGLELTGNRKKLMELVGIDKGTLGDQLVVEGDWKSPDNINVHIRSALVPARKGRKLSKDLLAEDNAASVWLPTLSHDDDEYQPFRTKRLEYNPWIVTPSTEGSNLEQYDPLSVITVDRRPRFTAGIISNYLLKPGDPFQRFWHLPHKKIVATTNAWGYEIPYDEGGELGVRLRCRTDFLCRLLDWKKADLILLIKLNRYEMGHAGYRASRFSHTVSVLRVTRDLKLEYFAGPVNEIQESPF